MTIKGAVKHAVFSQVALEGASDANQHFVKFGGAFFSYPFIAKICPILTHCRILLQYLLQVLNKRLRQGSSRKQFAAQIVGIAILDVEEINQ